MPQNYKFLQRVNRGRFLWHLNDGVSSSFYHSKAAQSLPGTLSIPQHNNKPVQYPVAHFKALAQIELQRIVVPVGYKDKQVLY